VERVERLRMMAIILAIAAAVTSEGPLDIWFLFGLVVVLVLQGTAIDVAYFDSPRTVDKQRNGGD
jgi:uncharacterized protein (DUF58 family)